MLIFFLIAIVPPILIAYYIYKKDIYEREPRKYLVNSFLFGCISVIPILIFEIIFNENLFDSLFMYVFFGIALVEEGFKFIFLRFYMYKKSEFNEPMDGIVYAVMVSLGFATVENISYVFGNVGTELSVGILRMFTAIPLHAVCGVILGYYVGKAKFSSEPEKEMIIGLFLATLVHALYNYFIFLGTAFVFSIIVLIIAIVYSKKAIKLFQEDSKLRSNKS